MNHLLFAFTFIIALTSCTESVKQHDRLIGWSSEFISEDGEKFNGYYHNHLNFIKPYFKRMTIGDTLVVTTLKEINACGNTIADIKISSDTIYLLTRQISDIVCSSVTFNKYTYKIINLEKRHFIIVSEK